MQLGLKFLLLLACLAVATPSYAKKAGAKAKSGASSAKGGKGAKAGGREKHIVREAQARKQDKSKIDFDETDISGERRAPLGSMVNQNKNDKNYDLIKIRLRWHPEMVQSTAALENGS